ncbi:unnamed protein product [Scytosiphon promiscuus]
MAWSELVGLMPRIYDKERRKDGSSCDGGGGGVEGGSGVELNVAIRGERT